MLKHFERFDTGWLTLQNKRRENSKEKQKNNVETSLYATFLMRNIALLKVSNDNRTVFKFVHDLFG